MNILSVDTSSNSASLGFFKKTPTTDYITLYLKHWNKSRSHSEVITEYFNEGLQASELNISDINLICLGKGPGSFTGIRVALNFAKTIAYSQSIPIYTINSLQPIALMNSQRHSQILVLNNAFRNMVYGAGYLTTTFTEVEQPFACEPNQISNYLSKFHLEKKILIVGNGYEVYKTLFNDDDTQHFFTETSCSTSVDAEYILKSYLRDKSPELLKWNEVLPLYIRGSEAEEKLKLKKLATERNN